MVENLGQVSVSIMDQSVEHSVPGMRRKCTMFRNRFGFGENTLAESIERNLAQFLEFLPAAFDLHEVLLA